MHPPTWFIFLRHLRLLVPDQLLKVAIDPGARAGPRAFEPSNLRATALRYHASMVSGGATFATSPRTLRPIRCRKSDSRAAQSRFSTALRSTS